jgi:hypothetical protein
VHTQKSFNEAVHGLVDGREWCTSDNGYDLTNLKEVITWRDNG